MQCIERALCIATSVQLESPAHVVHQVSLGVVGQLPRVEGVREFNEVGGERRRQVEGVLVVVHKLVHRARALVDHQELPLAVRRKRMPVRGPPPVLPPLGLRELIHHALLTSRFLWGQEVVPEEEAHRLTLTAGHPKEHRQRPAGAAQVSVVLRQAREKAGGGRHALLLDPRVDPLKRLAHEPAYATARLRANHAPRARRSLWTCTVSRSRRKTTRMGSPGRSGNADAARRWWDWVCW